MNETQLVAESYGWLRTHPQAKNSEVPPHLLEAWLHSRPERAFHAAVFSFGYAQELARIAQEAVPPQDLLQDFVRWQWNLAAAEISRTTCVRVDPVPLFDHSDDITRARMRFPLA